MLSINSTISNTFLCFYYCLQDGFTALICAAQQGHVEIVQYLLDFACLQACPAHKVSCFLYLTLFTIYGAFLVQDPV